MRWRLFGAVLLVVVGIGAVVFVVVRPGTTAGADTQYLTARVTREDVVDDVAANGTLQPVTRYGLTFGAAPEILGSSSSSSSAASSGNGGSSSTTWPVTAVKVAIGQTVKKGQLLATADPSAIRSQISQVSSQLEVADLQLAQAVSDLDAAATTQQTRTAQIAYYNAQAQVAQLTTQRSTLNGQLADATLTAPVEGIVEAVNVIAGADAPSGSAIIVDSGGLQASVTIAETDLARVSVGQAASVTIAALNAQVTGKVASISPVAAGGGGNSSVVGYDVVLSLSGVPSSARAGMTASVSVTIAQAQNVLAVPAIALQTSGSGYDVRVMAADGSVSTQPVGVGLVTSTLAQITSGLAEGQAVVIGVATARSSAGTTATGGFGGLGGALGGGGFRGGGRVVTPGQ